MSELTRNPDWKHIHAISKENATVGCDWVGTVVEVGSDVTKPFKKGDRITGVTHGVNHSQIEDGSFAEYAVVKGDIAIKVPDNITDEEAATLGVGVTTVGQGLYQTLQLPLPDQPSTKKDYVLIYGGRYDAHRSFEVFLGMLTKAVPPLASLPSNSPSCKISLKCFLSEHIT